MKQILDVGCGTGYRSYILSKRKNVKVTGIDISGKNIIKAKDRYPQIKFIRMNAERLSFKNRIFDEVYATDVLEHVDNLAPVVKEMSRVIKPSGKVSVLVPGEKSEKWLLNLRPSFHQEIHHVRIFEGTELVDLLSKHGFKMTKMLPQNFLQHLELFYFFKTKKKSTSQLDIGSWNDSLLSVVVHTFVSFFDPFWVFNSPLKYFPVWLITLPIGYVINFFGNKIMPKSVYYEFVKLK